MTDIRLKSANPSAAAGEWAELEAAAYAERRGYECISKNYRSRAGEIDLIVRDGREICFVEVRYRRDRRYGGALESITAAKRRKIIATANHFLAFTWNGPDPICRFDVVLISGTAEDHELTWMEAAFEP